MSPSDAAGRPIDPYEEFKQLLAQTDEYLEEIERLCRPDLLTPLQVEQCLNSVAAEQIHIERTLTHLQQRTPGNPRSPALQDALDRLRRLIARIERRRREFERYRRLDRLTPQQRQKVLTRKTVRQRLQTRPK